MFLEIMRVFPRKEECFRQVNISSIDLLISWVQEWSRILSIFSIKFIISIFLHYTSFPIHDSLDWNVCFQDCYVSLGGCVSLKNYSKKLLTVFATVFFILHHWTLTLAQHSVALITYGLAKPSFISDSY